MACSPAGNVILTDELKVISSSFMALGSAAMLSTWPGCGFMKEP